MNRRRVLMLLPFVVALVGALTATVLAPDPVRPPGTLQFTFDGGGAAPMSPALIRRRTITPEFDPPLDLRAGRVIFVRGFVACDPGEAFTVDVVVTQGEARAEGRTAGRCTGEVQEWTAVATARGRTRFSEGPAHACAVATTRKAGITDTFEWCADPVLSLVA